MKTQVRILSYEKIIVFIVLTLLSFRSFAQTKPVAEGQVATDSIPSVTDSLPKLLSRKHPIYKGLDISMGAPRFNVKSNIIAIKNLSVDCIGGSIGGVLANPVGKLKGSIGIYYSDDNVPYTFDMVTANLSVNVYLLRLKQVKYHTVEPYAFAGLTQLKTSLFGSYVPETANGNMSTGNAPYIAAINSSQLVIGTGVEFQLESDNHDFIHMYAEAGYGHMFRSAGTSNKVSGTSIPNTLYITIGLSLGKFK